MKKTFEEIVLFARTGLNPRQNFKLGQGHNNYITIKNIKNNTLVIDDNTDVVNDEAIRLIHKRSQIKKGDILFASIGRMGDMYIIEEDPEGWDINESVFAFTIDTSIVRQKYFYYIFKVKSTLDYLASNSSGSTFKSIKMNQLKKMVFDIPSLEEQDQIIEALDKVDHVIAMRKQEICLLDELIKARFVEMFGDPILNEKEWSCVMITDVCQLILGGGTPSKKCEEFFKGKIPWVTPKDMKQSIINDSIDHITEDAIVHSTTNLIPIWSVLMVIRSGILKHALPVAINSIPVTINQDMKAFIPGENITAEFLMYFFKAIEEDVLSKVRGVTADNIDFKTFQKRKIIVPPMELQNQFAAFVTQVDKSKAAVQKALDETQLLFDSLMQEYFG